MFRSPALRIGLGVIAALVVLGMLRFKPWKQAETPAHVVARKELEVGYLPVT